MISRVAPCVIPENCAHCGRPVVRQPIKAINRAVRLGLPLFCNRECFGLAHRRKVIPTKAELVERKRLYDIEYRAKNKDLLKAKKAAAFLRTYDPVKAAIKRKQTMPRHIEYCRQPKYKAYKREYDKKLRAMDFGNFWESHLLLIDLMNEVRQRTTRYDIRVLNGTLNKHQERKREYERQTGITKRSIGYGPKNVVVGNAATD